jgi:cellulose synthase/poly-beta-1,6-N-acetylglucosamine synthase-like glycosyltransferase
VIHPLTAIRARLCAETEQKRPNSAAWVRDRHIPDDTNDLYFDAARVVDSPRAGYLVQGVTGALTILFGGMVTWDFLSYLSAAFGAGEVAVFLELCAIYGPIYLLLYGCVSFLIAGYGQIARQRSYCHASRPAIEAIYDRQVAPILALVPSFREDEIIIRHTLVSAALMEYPGRTVVLLIDDSPNPATPEDAAALTAARRLPGELQALFEEAADRFQTELDRFEERARLATTDATSEMRRVAALYDEAAAWLESLGANRSYYRCPAEPDHTDRLFRDKIVLAPARAHRSRASMLRRCAAPMVDGEIRREYRRLAALFRVRFASFERKRYANLSHARNKAMNLNSYIGLIGGDFCELQREDGLHLEPVTRDEATLSVSTPDYIVTLDADTVVLSDYALRLVQAIEQPGNGRVAVVQTPYSAIPGARGIERLAGATTDVQFLNHQGLTHFGAGSWVGSNALIRLAALRDIVTERGERGHTVKVYIQDRTVIEDTAATVDLILKGWRLYSVPLRLSYSATPPDFGSLVIQRRRWATGGLIVVPALLRFALAGRLRLDKALEVFLRFYYLTSTAAVSLAFLTLILPAYDDQLLSTWLPLAASPYQLLYGYDLKRIGYRWRDLPLIYSLNMLLLPVNLIGTLQTLRQIATGRKPSFTRTPKVAGRTAVPSSCLLFVYGFLVFSFCCAGYDLVDRHYYHLMFTALNSAAFLYGIATYIGFRNSWMDLAAMTTRWWSAAGRLKLAPVWPRLRGTPLITPIAPAVASSAQSAEGP